MEQNVQNQSATKSSRTRLLLYVHYDRDGKVDSHVVYQIRALYEFGISIIFISNSPVSESGREQLLPYITGLRVRSDEGYDWTAWKEAILELGSETLGLYDDLILMNDSCYGPFFPLEEMFAQMDQKPVDFWGITENTDPRFTKHLQPYFCCIKRHAACSESFIEFFRELPPIVTYNDAIFSGEIAFSSFLEEQNFCYATYIDAKELQSIPEIGVNEPLVYSMASEFIQDYRIPFIKRKSFHTDFGQRIAHGSAICAAITDSGSEYPQKLIYEHMRRVAPLSWHKNLPGTLNVFDRHCAVRADPHMRVAVMLHVFYPDTLDEALQCLRQIPYPYDLLLSCSEEVKRKLDTLDVASLPSVRKVLVRVVEDRGRDVLPWLRAFADVHLSYELVLKLQIKRSGWLHRQLAARWNRFILESTLASPGYVSKIIELFSKESQLGMVFHPTAPIFNMYAPHGYQGCSEDERYRKEWLERLHLTPPEETSSFVYPIGVFWYRPEALRSLLSCDVQPVEFPPEPFPATGTVAHGLERAIPYIAQAHGFYYKLAIPGDLLASGFQMYEDSTLSHYRLPQPDSEPPLAPPKRTSYDPCARWSPFKRRLTPLLTHLPSALFPITRARALYASGYADKAIRVLNREKKRFQRAMNILEQMEVSLQEVPVSIPVPVAEKAEPADTSRTSIRALAYYLPQFHPFPENDAWWGKGFTEWTNVIRAHPLFQGHIQPRIPGVLGYYDLRDINVMKRQAELAQQFGIYGFCFYYYYFNGKRLMESPLKNFLHCKDVNIPFCLCWANENWTRRWDGREKDILIEQKYSPEDDIAFIKGLLPYFRDERYVRIHGKPVLLIYNVKQFPDIRATVERWRETLRKEKEDVYLVMVHFYGPHDPRPCGFDAAAEFRPHELKHSWLAYSAVPGLIPSFKGSVWDYGAVAALNPPCSEEYPLFRGVCVNFDNTARRGSTADLFVNSTPGAYEGWFDQVCRFTHDTMPPEERYVFINAWNEWAEGAMLEPDRAWGFGYLNATSRVLSNY